jgi:hypothetical protein
MPVADDPLWQEWLAAEKTLEEARDQLRTVEHLALGDRDFQEGWGAYRIALRASMTSPTSFNRHQSHGMWRRIGVQDETDGHVTAPVIECVDDQETIGKAAQLVDDRAVELWEGARFILRFPNTALSKRRVRLSNSSPGISMARYLKSGGTAADAGHSVQKKPLVPWRRRVGTRGRPGRSWNKCHTVGYRTDNSRGSW